MPQNVLPPCCILFQQIGRSIKYAIKKYFVCFSKIKKQQNSHFASTCSTKKVARNGKWCTLLFLKVYFSLSHESQLIFIATKRQRHKIGQHGWTLVLKSCTDNWNTWAACLLDLCGILSSPRFEAFLVGKTLATWNAGGNKQVTRSHVNCILVWFSHQKPSQSNDNSISNQEAVERLGK